MGVCGVQGELVGRGKPHGDRRPVDQETQVQCASREGPDMAMGWHGGDKVVTSARECEDSWSSGGE